MMKKTIIFAILFTALLASQISLAAPSFQTDSGEAYVVQANDWLSKLADKYYGNPLAYPIIVEATNSKANEDSSFTLIDNPDLIEIGQKIWIPATSGSVTLPPTTTESSPTTDLSGVTWTLTRYGSVDAPQSVPDDVTVTIEFSVTDNQLSGTGGCNNYFASFEQENNRLTISTVGATRMACPELMMDMETTYFSALEKVNSFEYQADMLTLLYNDGQDILVFQPQTEATSPSQDEMSVTDKEMSTDDDTFITDLKNETYRGVYEEAITLSEGKYEGEPFVEGGAARPTVVLVEDMTQRGDLNGDGLDDAATILVENSGGSGVFNYLAVVVNEDGAPVNVATQFLGDRVEINAIFIDATGQIRVDMVTHADDDPLCCPTLSETKVYQLQGTQLIEQDSSS